MAIKDISRKPYIEDNDTNVYIGLDLPIRRGNDIQGYFASTSTTIEAVKNNIRNLLNTYKGERLMQPNIGIDLRQYLFNQIDEGTVLSIQDSILDTFNYWLPFVEVRNIEVKSSGGIDTGTNSIHINITFNITQDPNTLESVQLYVTSNDNQANVDLSTNNMGTTLGTGGY